VQEEWYGWRPMTPDSVPIIRSQSSAGERDDRGWSQHARPIDGPRNRSACCGDAERHDSVRRSGAVCADAVLKCNPGMARQVFVFAATRRGALHA